MVRSAVSTIDVWRLALDKPDPSLSELLSVDEIQRGQRFHFTKDRDRFIHVRASVRIILGGYLQLDPWLIRFRYGAAGKPFLADAINPGRLHFNISHSGGLALAAVAWDREVGVDIEKIRPGVDLCEIAERFFSGREVADLFALPADQQVAGFFNCWTRKEAFLKATGAGLSMPLHSFGVSLKPGEPARLTFIHDDALEKRNWTMRDISPAAGYVAALACEGSGSQICFRAITS